MKHVFYTDCHVTISLHKFINCFMKIQKLTYQHFSRKRTKESKARPPMTSDTQAPNNKQTCETYMMTENQGKNKINYLLFLLTRDYVEWNIKQANVAETNYSYSKCVMVCLIYYMIKYTYLLRYYCIMVICQSVLEHTKTNSNYLYTVLWMNFELTLTEHYVIQPHEVS